MNINIQKVKNGFSVVIYHTSPSTSGIVTTINGCITTPAPETYVFNTVTALCEFLKKNYK